MTVLALLGPQRLRPILAGVVEDLGLEGPIAAVTAGWQEREAEDDELSEHLGGRTVNLGLYERCELVFAADRELFAAHRRRQDRLRRLQEVYRLRLHHTHAALRELMGRQGDPEVLDLHRQAALDALRRLDAEHLEAVRRLNADFEARWRPAERPVVAEQRRQVAETLARCDALAVAGGHVALLLNRMRIFGLPALAAGLPIVAWSAGAMIMGQRIVLFHDSPPQGAGNAEVLENGFDLAGTFLPLPHARRRLRLEDPQRVAMFARRFLPRISLAMDEGSRLVLDGDRWQADGGVRRLTPAGEVVELESYPG